jgi:eukaryotic-like serine/threonine-protein kinase
MPAAGSRVGHYQVLRVLGRGGMGEVFAGWDETLQRHVALKSIRADQRLGVAARSRFLREARILSQLDDPRICRIYDYVEGDDADLIVLELIEGKTLRQAIDDALEPAEKLRIAAEVAHALVTAHRAGVVHRDLKPENVMLTESGAVKVLDFGLARSTGGPDLVPALVAREAFDQPLEAGDTMARNALVPRTDGGASSETALGEMVGTPMYMSPEQARGEAITAASDIYSLGLMLQQLVTGRPPYDPHRPVAEILAMAARGESRPPSGADRALTALIGDMRSLAPTDRPTAIETLRRIEWIRSRRTRRLRRLGVAAAVLIAMLATIKYVTDVRSALAEAKMRRAQAGELIGFMVGDLRQKLEPVGRLEVLDDVGEKALTYFASLEAEELTAPELRMNARTLSQLGEVRIAQGDVGAAEKVLEQSLALARGAVRRDPAGVANHVELALSHYWMANVARQKGDLPVALQHFRESLRIGEDVARRDPSSREAQIEVSYGHANVGSILEQQGNVEQALRHYRDSVAIKQRQLVAGDVKAETDLARTLNKIGVASRFLGRLADAAEAFRREHELLTAALRKEPENAGWKKRLAASHSFIGLLREDAGDTAGALHHLEQERAIESALVGHDPGNASWQRNLAMTDGTVGRLLRHRGDLAGAEQSYRRALARLEPLVAKDANRSGWREDTVRLYTGLAAVLAERNELRGAAEAIAMARSMCDVAAAGDRRAQQNVRGVALVAGVIADRQGRSSEARREWEGVLHAVAPAPGQADLRDNEQVAQALLLLGRVDEAKPLVERLAEAGYRNHDLTVLWQAVINRNTTLQRRGTDGRRHPAQRASRE